MHNEVNIPSKKWKCSILHKRCPFFSAEQTVRRWRSDGGRPQSDLGWLRSLTNHQHLWLARNVLSGQRNVDFKIECMHYFYSLLCTPLGQCVASKAKQCNDVQMTCCPQADDTCRTVGMAPWIGSSSALISIWYSSERAPFLAWYFGCWMV